MRGLSVFMAKEFMEIVRTWRLWVLPLVMVSFAVMSPIIARLTPQLVGSIASDVVIELPDPTTIDAYLQFSKNNTQIALFAIIISMAGMISGERRSGTAVLVLTKPISRGAFVVSKVVSNWALVIVATVLGWAVCLGVTALLFELNAVGDFVMGTVAWLVLALLMVAVVSMFSAVIKSQAGAAGAGVGFYLVMVILSAWGPARDNTFAGLFTASDRLVTGQEVELMLPIVTAIALAVLCVAVAVAVFNRQEL
jgi:ABC-2 type transport system permease protein